MPRIHGGNNQHRGSSHSRRAASADKQRSRSGATTITIGDKMDIDDFEDISYDDEVNPTELHSFATDDAKQQRRRTKQQKFTLEDTSSEEDEEELPEASYKSSSKSLSTTRKLTSKKKKSTK
eukprot:scaffold12580_cov89-Skeletonema_dohrnii-CCMP3373.AAC.2